MGSWEEVGGVSVSCDLVYLVFVVGGSCVEDEAGFFRVLGESVPPLFRGVVFLC